MYLLTVVIKNEELLDELITGWLDIGITDATVIETTDSVQLISHHVPIFAGFRSLTSGGMLHNRTIFTAIKEKRVLDQAITFLKEVCGEAGKPNQGLYFVTLIEEFEKLGKKKSPDSQSHTKKWKKTT